MEALVNLTKRQNEIVEKSIELISKNGIQGLTIKNLSREIGISEPAIYRHFKNKSEILKTLLMLFKLQIDNTFMELYNSEVETKDKIEIFFNIHIEKFLKTPHIASVIFSEELFLNEPQFDLIVNDIIKSSIKNMEVLIRMGMEKNEIRSELNSEDLSVIMLGSLRLLVKEWYISGFNTDLKEKVENLKDTILKIINKRS